MIKQYDSIFVYNEDGSKSVRNNKLTTLFIPASAINPDGTIQRAIVGDALIQEKGYQVIVERTAAERFKYLTVSFEGNFVQLEVAADQSINLTSDEEMQKYIDFLKSNMMYM